VVGAGFAVIIQARGAAHTMSTTPCDETSRTSPLALWRYGHDYLRTARELCGKHRIRCIESQAPYHLAAQGIEFALLAFLRAHGATMESLHLQIAHSLPVAFAQCEALGLPPLPAPWRPAIREIAACHREGQFVHLAADDDAFPDIDPLVEAGVWLLDRVAPDVAAHYVVHLGAAESPTIDEFVGRMRTDLCATAGRASGDGFGFSGLAGFAGASGAATAPN